MKRVALLLFAALAACASAPPSSAFAEVTAHPSVATTVAIPVSPTFTVPAPRSLAHVDSTVLAVRAVTAFDSAAFRAPQRSNEGRAKLIVGLLAVGIMGSLRTVAADNDSFPVRDTVRQQLNQLSAWIYFVSRNKMISTTVAAFPGVAIATTATKIKTTNATVLLNAGAVNALAATDNFWALTGGVLAINSFRKYLLLSDASDAATVIASSDASTAAGCAFSGLPADGQAIVGSILVATDGTHTFTPATTALSATGITTTYYDGLGDDAIYPFATVTP